MTGKINIAINARILPPAALIRLVRTATRITSRTVMAENSIVIMNDGITVQ